MSASPSMGCPGGTPRCGLSRFREADRSASPASTSSATSARTSRARIRSARQTEPAPGRESPPVIGGEGAGRAARRLRYGRRRRRPTTRHRRRGGHGGPGPLRSVRPLAGPRRGNGPLPGDPAACAAARDSDAGVVDDASVPRWPLHACRNGRSRSKSSGRRLATEPERVDRWSTHGRMAAPTTGGCRRVMRRRIPARSWEGGNRDE